VSLLGLFQTTLGTIPADVPYLQSDPARPAVWRDRLASYCCFRVGIAWRERDGWRNCNAWQYSKVHSLMQVREVKPWYPAMRLFGQPKDWLC